MTGPRGRKRSTLARALALGLGALLLLGQLRGLLSAPLADSPLPPLPEPLGPGLATGLGLLLVIAGLRPRAWCLQLATALLLVAAGLHGRQAEPRVWRALALVLVALALLAGARSPAPKLALPWAVLTLIAGAVAWPLLLMLEAGRQGPRGDAPPFDAVVVLGARTYADGRPSLALTDRVRTGSQLVVAASGDPALLLSGGPGDGDVHETQAMAQLARDFGVRAGRIQLDPSGLDTRATARAAAAEAQARGWRQVVAISHAYHVPRVRQAFRDAGLPVRGVAAVESRRLAKRAQFLAREVAAWWVYWLRGFRPS